VFPKEVLLLHQAQVAAAYERLRTELLRPCASGLPHSFLFTSATTGEGKTLTAVNTAIALAQMGVRVLLIDANLHQPACHSMLALHHSFGLAEFLVGQGELSKLLQPTLVEHLIFLSAGSPPVALADLPDSRNLRAALVFLQKMYDYVVIDAPALESVSDTLLLATMVDGVALVVDSQHTPAQQVEDARQRLAQSKESVLGVVLNKVDVNSHEFTRYVQHSQSAAAHNGMGKEAETSTMMSNLRH
jgi:capsular exopolysaccharide synthesis family protein